MTVGITVGITGLRWITVTVYLRDYGGDYGDYGDRLLNPLEITRDYGDYGEITGDYGDYGDYGGDYGDMEITVTWRLR